MSATRLDTVLVQRGLARSRTQAAKLIADERVMVAGQPAHKPAFAVEPEADIAVDLGDDWASRGAHKLIGALDECSIDVAGLRALDAGASTGGFTDVLLRRGAARVAAVDVGAGQLIPRLAADPRVSVHDHVNIRSLGRHGHRERAEATVGVDLTPTQASLSASAHAGAYVGHAAEILAALGGAPEIVVADLSFISLTLVLPALADLAAPGADLLPMVKPQFEVGKGRLGAHGVVRDRALRAEAVMGVIDAAAALGWGVAAVAPSALPGPSGNVEYFVHLRRDAETDSGHARAMTLRAVEDGPR